MPETFNFSIALSHLKDGKKVASDGWNGKGMYLEAQIPDEHSKMTIPYIFIKTAQGDLVPWVVSHGDMFREDWYIVE